MSSSSSAAPWALKFDFRGDVRRRPCASQPTFEAVLEGLASLYSLTTAEAAALVYKYRDDEGDLCTLTKDTLPDALSLGANARILRLVVSGGTTAQQASATATATATAGRATAADATMGDAEGQRSWQNAIPPPFAHIMQMLFAHDSTAAEALPNMLVHFIPMLTQSVPNWQADVERFAADKPDMVLPILAALRQGLEPFPQFQDTYVALERMQSTNQLAGLGAVIGDMLRTFSNLPLEQQYDVASVAFQEVIQNIMQMAPGFCSAAAAEPEPPQVHHHIVCDGCGMAPLIGPRFKCKTCPDFDFCGACHSRKNELHPAHEFECMPQAPQRGPCGGPPGAWFGKGGWAGKGEGHHHWGRHCWAPWGKGRGMKGLGKPWWGKGKGKCRPWWSQADTSSSSDSDSSSSSERPTKEMCKLWKKQMKAAKREWKKARKEAKQQAKVAKKAAKKACKKGKSGEQPKSSEQPEPEHVVTADVEMNCEAAPSAPPAVDENSLQHLHDMGFTCRELNIELLVKHEGNMQAVLEQLL